MSSVAKLIGAGIFAAGIAAPVAAQYQPYPQDEQPYPQDEQYPQGQQQYPQDEQQYPQDEQSNPQYQQQYPGETEQYPQEEEQYPQTQQGYPPYQQYPQTYPGYGQTYTDPIAAIIDQRLGSGYSFTDRQAARQCAMAAIARAQSQYRGYGDYNPDEQDEPYAGSFRLSAITGLERRSDGLQVQGQVSTAYGRGYGGYGQDYNAGDLSFRCNVDDRGAVTSVQLYQGDRGY